MNKTMPVAVQSCAERFAENWKAQNPTEDDTSSLDDSLTNLQWLHSISIQDLTPATSMAQSPSPSTNSCDSDDHSETSDGCKQAVIAKEPNIDYKNDATQKPPYSYATLICMAMRETNKTKITLSAIYKWIKENFMYYRQADPTWQVCSSPPFCWFPLFQTVKHESENVVLVLVRCVDLTRERYACQ